MHLLVPESPVFVPVNRRGSGALGSEAIGPGSHKKIVKK